MESVVDHFVKMIGKWVENVEEHIQKFARKSIIVIRLCRYLLNKGDPDGHDKFGILWNSSWIRREISYWHSPSKIVTTTGKGCEMSQKSGY